MPKSKFHKEGDLPEEFPEEKSDTDSPDNQVTIYDRETGALETVPDNLEATQPIEINAINEFGLGLQMNTIRPIAFPQFTTKQQAYRFAAWLVFMAEMLPDEPMDHTFLEIADAIKNT